MLIVAIYDIHGNPPALEAVLQAIKANAADQEPPRGFTNMLVLMFRIIKIFCNVGG